MNTTPRKTAEEAATIIQALVTECIEEGQLPASIRDFSEMHDYIDANELLIQGLYTSEEFDSADDAAADRDNAAMALVNVWIKNGMPTT